MNTQHANAEGLMNLSKRDKRVISKAYERACTAVLITEEEPLDRLMITGADRIDLMERLSTNAVIDRVQSESVRTALLEANGRLIDLLDLYFLPKHLLLAASHGRAETVDVWLKRHIFFQDDVHVEMMPPWRWMIGVYGPRSTQYLKEHFDQVIKLAELQFIQIKSTLISPMRWSSLSGFHILTDEEEVAQSLLADRDPHWGPNANIAIEALRIEAGIAGRGQEIKPGIIPLGLRLNDAISHTKGCYIGQEIIARIESRGELATELTGVQLSQPVSPQAPLMQSGKEIGTLTSCAYSPVHGWVGLALIKNRRLVPEIANTTVLGTPISFQGLPFPTT
jgi:folate-binding protein YgfZ